MATSSLCNLLSFLFPSQQTPHPKTLPTQLPLSSHSLPSLSSSSSSSSSSRSKGNRDDCLPVTLGDGSNSSSKDMLSVVFPSLAYSNTLFFKSAYNVQVIVGEDEPEEALLRRFRREVMKAGVIQECKRRRFFENKQEEKKRKTREAAKRNRRRSRRPFRATTPMENKEETQKKTSEDEEDNWDLPDGDLLPY